MRLTSLFSVSLAASEIALDRSLKGRKQMAGFREFLIELLGNLSRLLRGQSYQAIKGILLRQVELWLSSLEARYRYSIDDLSMIIGFGGYAFPLRPFLRLVTWIQLHFALMK